MEIDLLKSKDLIIPEKKMCTLTWIQQQKEFQIMHSSLQLFLPGFCWCVFSFSFCLPLCKGKLSVANRLWRKFRCTALWWNLLVFRPVDSLQCTEVVFTHFCMVYYFDYNENGILVNLTTVHWNEHFWHNRVFFISSFH